jgi:two-component system, OmpR family, phosphate regulon sensor histidine kinase PhoR
LIAIAVAVAAALAVGILVNAEAGWIVLAIALLAIAVYDALQLGALARWLEHGGSPHPPRAHGSWDRLHALFHRSRRMSAAQIAELTSDVKRWQQAARALPEGVVLLDGDRIEWLNEVAHAHLGIDPARDLGRYVTHIVRHPEFVRYLDVARFDKPLIVEPPHAPGHQVSIQVIPFGEWQRVILTRDITQFRAVEKMRREFVANVSHELRTPLTVVAGFIETLRDERDPAAVARYLDLMADQSGRMLRLVEDLLTLSSLESAPPPPMDEVVAMGPLVERLAAEARALSAGRHRIEVEGAGTPIDLVGSDKELASAFGNLVSNAVRYTPADGTVRLRWRATDEGAAFEVEDTGIGIEPDHIPRLTERFYRVDRGRSRETGGTGLGLAIVKHALVRHGATLHTASEPGKGSCFSARFIGPRLRPKSPPASDA